MSAKRHSLILRLLLLPVLLLRPVEGSSKESPTRKMWPDSPHYLKLSVTLI